MNNQSQAVTLERKVVCKGQEGGLGHPMVYLKIAKNEKSVVCPYCSKKFILKSK